MKIPVTDETYYRCEFHAMDANYKARRVAIDSGDAEMRYEAYRKIGVAAGDVGCPRQSRYAVQSFVGCKQQAWAYRKQWVKVGVAASKKAAKDAEVESEVA